jgi:hypothetical protein
MKTILTSIALFAAAGNLSAGSLSFTGALDSPESVFEDTFTLTAADTVTFQTWEFGGGTNAAGQAISPGGFDPLIALFNGPAATATIYVDSSGNPLADADNLINPPWSYVGNCPPAGTVAIGADQDCGDDFMQLALPAGTYTLLLTDANYIPNSIYDNGALSEGFTDLTGGVFQTCDTDGSCITPDGNYAVDIVSTHADLTTSPEPGALSLLGVGLAGLAGLKQFRKRRHSPHTKKERRYEIREVFADGNRRCGAGRIAPGPAGAQGGARARRRAGPGGEYSVRSGDRQPHRRPGASRVHAVCGF